MRERENGVIDLGVLYTVLLGFPKDIIFMFPLLTHRAQSKQSPHHIPSPTLASKATYKKQIN